MEEIKLEYFYNIFVDNIKRIFIFFTIIFTILISSVIVLNLILDHTYKSEVSIQVFSPSSTWFNSGYYVDDIDFSGFLQYSTDIDDFDHDLISTAESIYNNNNDIEVEIYSQVNEPSGLIYTISTKINSTSLDEIPAEYSVEEFVNELQIMYVKYVYNVANFDNQKYFYDSVETSDNIHLNNAKFTAMYDFYKEFYVYLSANWRQMYFEYIDNTTSKNYINDYSNFSEINYIEIENDIFEVGSLLADVLNELIVMNNFAVYGKDPDLNQQEHLEYLLTLKTNLLTRHRLNNNYLENDALTIAIATLDLAIENVKYSTFIDIINFDYTNIQENVGNTIDKIDYILENIQGNYDIDNINVVVHKDNYIGLPIAIIGSAFISLIIPYTSYLIISIRKR